MSVKFNPNQPITVTVDFGSPQVAAYKLWYKKKLDVLYTTLGTGTDKGPASPANYPYAVSGLDSGSSIAYHVALSGNADSAYRVTITLLQGGVALAGGVAQLTGTIAANNRATLDGTFNLV